MRDDKVYASLGCGYLLNKIRKPAAMVMMAMVVMVMVR